MTNYKMHITYDGSRYNGWQRQANHPEKTIQGRIEHVLSLLCKESIQIIGSGRTDAGVHAKMQVANFHTSLYIAPEFILDYLNQYLPKDIVVTELHVASERFHARYNAKGKRYRYTIDNNTFADPFIRHYAYHLSESLDLEAMRQAAQLLIGTYDFKSFTSMKSKKKSTIRTLYEINITKEGSKVYLSYYGNGFLQHMVRILTGTLVEVGLHQRSIHDVSTVLNKTMRSEAGFTAPAHGLCLEEVFY